MTSKQKAPEDWNDKLYEWFTLYCDEDIPYNALHTIVLTALQTERQRCEEIAQRAFHEGCSSGMDEYRTSRGGKLWQETNTYKSLTQPNNPK